MAGTVDPEALEARLREIVDTKDTSPSTIAWLVEALGGNVSWWEANPYYDGLTAPGWTVELWERVVPVIASLGDPALDPILAKIRAGDAGLFRRAATLGPRIVAEAMLVVERGPDTLAGAAAYVLERNNEMFGPADAIVNFLLAFDRHVPETNIVGDLLVATWPRLATPIGRATIVSRWADADLRGWIEQRIDDKAHRVRHLVALLAVVPLADALPLLRRLLAIPHVQVVFEPLLVIDVDRAREVIEADRAVRELLRPLALRAASGGMVWDNSRFGQPRDHALVAAFTSDADVWDTLIVEVERGAAHGSEMWQPLWTAVAAHVRHDRSRFARAAAAAIRTQLTAGGPGDPKPRFGLETIAALDPNQMCAMIQAQRAEVIASKNRWCFEQLFASLGRTL